MIIVVLYYYYGVYYLHDGEAPYVLVLFSFKYISASAAGFIIYVKMTAYRRIIVII